MNSVEEGIAIAVAGADTGNAELIREGASKVVNTLCPRPGYDLESRPDDIRRYMSEEWKDKFHDCSFVDWPFGIAALFEEPQAVARAMTEPTKVGDIYYTLHTALKTDGKEMPNVLLEITMAADEDGMLAWDEKYKNFDELSVDERINAKKQMPRVHGLERIGLSFDQLNTSGFVTRLIEAVLEHLRTRGTLKGFVYRELKSSPSYSDGTRSWLRQWSKREERLKEYEEFMQKKAKDRAGSADNKNQNKRRRK